MNEQLLIQTLDFAIEHVTIPQAIALYKVIESVTGGGRPQTLAQLDLLLAALEKVRDGIRKRDVKEELAVHITALKRSRMLTRAINTN